MKFVINLMWSLCLSNVTFAEVNVHFQQKITAEASQLGDILYIEKAENHWRQLPLPCKPHGGETLHAKQMLNWLRTTWPAIHWQWQGNKSIKVEKKVQSEARSLVLKARHFLEERLINSYQKITLTPFARQSIQDSVLAVEKFQGNVHITFPIAKRVCVWLHQNNHHIPIWFDVKAYTKVPIARTGLAYHTVLTTSHITWKSRDIAGMSRLPLHHIPTDSWLKRSLEKGKVIKESDLEPMPLIVHGKTTQILVRTQQITIETTAVALRDGYLHQRIPFKNLQNQKRFFAKVIGTQKAEVIE